MTNAFSFVTCWGSNSFFLQTSFSNRSYNIWLDDPLFPGKRCFCNCGQDRTIGTREIPLPISKGRDVLFRPFSRSVIFFLTVQTCSTKEGQPILFFIFYCIFIFYFYTVHPKSTFPKTNEAGIQNAPTGEKGTKKFDIRMKHFLFETRVGSVRPTGSISGTTGLGSLYCNGCLAWVRTGKLS